MKSKPLFLISILTLVGTLITGASAWADEGADTNYWSISEILALRDEIEDEVYDACRFDPSPMCYDMAYMDIMWSKREYEVFDHIDNRRFLITSVNPTLATMRVMYINERLSDTLARGYAFYDDPSALYAVWLDKNTYNYNFANQYNNGMLPSSTHMLAVRFDIGNSPEYMPNQEIEYPIDRSISENPTGQIYYNVLFSNGGSYLDLYDYSDCMNSPDYEDGAECNLLVEKSSGNFVYVPVKNTTPEPEPEPTHSSDPEPNPTAPSDSEPTSSDSEPTTNVGTPEIAPDSSMSSVAAPAIQANSVDKVATTAVAATTTAYSSNTSDETQTQNPQSSDESAPEQGIDHVVALGSSAIELPTVGDADGRESGNIIRASESEFPWWILLLAAAGVGIIAWLFWPNRREKSKNL